MWSSCGPLRFSHRGGGSRSGSGSGLNVNSKLRRSSAAKRLLAARIRRRASRGRCRRHRRRRRGRRRHRRRLAQCGAVRRRIADDATSTEAPRAASSAASVASRAKAMLKRDLLLRATCSRRAPRRRCGLALANFGRGSRTACVGGSRRAAVAQCYRRSFAAVENDPTPLGAPFSARGPPLSSRMTTATSTPAHYGSILRRRDTVAHTSQCVLWPSLWGNKFSDN